MAVGDPAVGAGYELVPDTGENGRVRWGAREINRTRDYIAGVASTIANVWPISKGGTGATNKATARNNLGIKSGVSAPPSGNSGDIYFRIVD